MHLLIMYPVCKCDRPTLACISKVCITPFKREPYFSEVSSTHTQDHRIDSRGVCDPHELPSLPAHSLFLWFTQHSCAPHTGLGNAVVASQIVSRGVEESRPDAALFLDNSVCKWVRLLLGRTFTAEKWRSYSLSV